jgi:hypothetical protein
MIRNISIFALITFFANNLLAACPDGNYVESSDYEIVQSFCSDDYADANDYVIVEISDCPTNYIEADEYLPSDSAEYFDAKGIYGFTCTVE